MGAWGVGIFSNDTAADVRDAFRELVAEGVSAADATEQLILDYGATPDDPDHNDFWLGLAATQHRVGHVVPSVIATALAATDDEAELARWDRNQRVRRATALAKLAVALRKTPPPPKRLLPVAKVSTDLRAGQHFLYSTGEGPRRLFRVTRVNEDKGGTYAVVVVVDWDGSDRKLRKANQLKPTPSPLPLRDGEALGFVLLGEPDDPHGLEVLPLESDRRTPTSRWQGSIVTKWSDIDKHFGS